MDQLTEPTTSPPVLLEAKTCPLCGTSNHFLLQRTQPIPPDDFIVEITKYITMQPGDVLWMGADGTLPIGPGDTVEINISGVGTLRNSVVLEEPRQTSDKKEEISERV